LKDPAAALMDAFDLGFLMFAAPTLHDLLSSTERRDQFLEHFEALRGIVVDAAEPIQLFGWITYAMLQAARTAPSMRDSLITIDEDVFQKFMRDELGMFRFEQIVLTKAIQLLPLVARTEEFKRRGERRQLAFMKNEGFRMAMRIAETDYLLTPAQFAFWRNAYDKLSDELTVLEDEQKSKRRRRPRRPRKGKRGAAESESTEPIDEIDAASHDGEEDDDLSDAGDDDLDVVVDPDLDDDFSDIKLHDVEEPTRL
jgi:poly(A) polymerase